MAFGLEIRKRPKAEIKKRVAELLELVHLEQFAHRYPAQLSGGQRQRMALARALAVEPQVLLLDEPFGALDAQVRKELRAWLRRLHDQVHVTTVFVTHDQEEAMEVADSIVVMANGKVEQVGSPDELYDAPANDFVMSFLGPVTKLGGRLVRPHDLELFAEPRPGTVAATVTRVTRLGFEVRVDLEVDGDELWAQVTRGTAEQLGLEPGMTVHVRACPSASIRPDRVGSPARTPPDAVGRYVTSCRGHAMFGLVGTGHWARATHAPAIVATDGAELVGGVGAPARGGRPLADAHGVRAYDDFDALLDDVDAVAFSVPPDVQAPLATRAARAGKHLLLDKPIALTRERERRTVRGGHRGRRRVGRVLHRPLPARGTGLAGRRDHDGGLGRSDRALAGQRLRGGQPVRRLTVAAGEGRPVGPRTAHLSSC